MSLIGVIFLMAFDFGNSQEGAGFNLVKVQACTAINEREPVEVASVFPDTVGQIYCFTEFNGTNDVSNVRHVWYQNNIKRADVLLRVGKGRWRTWSSKKIIKEWIGRWRVDIISDQGETLGTISFEVVKS